MNERLDRKTRDSFPRQGNMINNLHIIHKQDFRLYRKYSNFNISFQSILFKTIPLDLSYNFLLESLKNMYKVSKINFIGIYSYKFLPTARVNLSLEIHRSKFLAVRPRRINFQTKRHAILWNQSMNNLTGRKGFIPLNIFPLWELFLGRWRNAAAISPVMRKMHRN